MGKLHKLRQAYNKLTKDEKNGLALLIGDVYWANEKITKNVRNIECWGYGKNKWSTPYKYYLASLLKKDGYTDGKLGKKEKHQLFRKPSFSHEDITWKKYVKKLKTSLARLKKSESLYLKYGA